MLTLFIISLIGAVEIQGDSISDSLQNMIEYQTKMVYSGQFKTMGEYTTSDRVRYVEHMLQYKKIDTISAERLLNGIILIYNLEHEKLNYLLSLQTDPCNRTVLASYLRRNLKDLTLLSEMLYKLSAATVPKEEIERSGKHLLESGE